MRTKRLLAATAATLTLLSAAAAALPIVGASANTIPGGTFMVDTWATWAGFTQSWQEDSDGSGGWIGFREETKWTAASFVPRVYYGATDWLTIRAAFPLEDRYFEPDAETSPRSSTGVGDIIVDPKIQLFRGESGYPRIAALAGVRFATGDTEGLEVAISDGSSDYMLGAVITHKEGDVSGHACVTYWFNGERENGSDVADLLAVLATLETPLDSDWELLWEFKGLFGETPSEFYRTYVCPGIMWNGERLHVGLSAQVSMAARGKVGVSTLDYDWAPYLRVYYCFF